jgi:hypothetical protein
MVYLSRFEPAAVGKIHGSRLAGLFAVLFARVNNTLRVTNAEIF